MGSTEKMGLEGDSLAGHLIHHPDERDGVYISNRFGEGLRCTEFRIGGSRICGVERSNSANSEFCTSEPVLLTSGGTSQSEQDPKKLPGFTVADLGLSGSTVHKGDGHFAHFRPLALQQP